MQMQQSSPTAPVFADAEVRLTPAQQVMNNEDIRQQSAAIGIPEDESYKLGCCLPCTPFLAVVAPNHQGAVFCCGTYKGTIKTSGCHAIGCCHNVVQVSMKRDILDIKDIKVLDANGNPIMISGNVSFAMTSAQKPTMDVENPKHYLNLQAMTVLKRIASRFPYEAPEGQPCLKSEAGTFATELRETLQTMALPTGAVILSFNLTDLSYAPEIAHAMLQKQQAQAMIQAREIIVKAAVHITHEAVSELKTLGHKIEADAEQKMCSNLLTVICSGHTATPTVPVGSS
jgi:regulator of protease activity HflC (stomatin/prohibitin superfamily)